MTLRETEKMHFGNWLYNNISFLARAERTDYVYSARGNNGAWVLLLTWKTHFVSAHVWPLSTLPLRSNGLRMSYSPIAASNGEKEI